MRSVLGPERAENMRHHENNGQPHDAGHMRDGNGQGHDQDPMPGVIPGDVGIGETENEIGYQVANAAAGDGHVQERIVQLNQPAVLEIGNAQGGDDLERTTEGDMPRIVGQSLVYSFGNGGHGDQEKYGEGRVFEHLPTQNQVHGPGQENDESDELDVECAQVQDREDKADGHEGDTGVACFQFEVLEGVPFQPQEVGRQKGYEYAVGAAFAMGDHRENPGDGVVVEDDTGQG